MNIPEILEKKPSPTPKQKKFHGKFLLGWEGVAKITSIEGWVKNWRLELEVKRFKDANAGRDPDNDEIMEMMKSVPDFRLKDLANDIRVNGVRQPITISAQGKLLDGNRRYYASRYILETLGKNDDKSDYDKIPVFVLSDDCTTADEERILVQENFYPSMKVEWTDYIKSNLIYKDIKNGIPIETLTQKYSWTQTRIRDAKAIMELIDEFIVFATTKKTDEQDGLGLHGTEAERVAAEKYQHFNEAKKSFMNRLDKDIEFKEHFFRWIYENKFASFAEVRVAAQAWDNQKARKILLSNDPQAGKKAKALIEFEKRFDEGAVEADSEIDEFVKFLGKMTTDQKQQITKETLSKLKNALETVVHMINSVKS